jgi:hypothetical protein
LLHDVSAHVGDERGAIEDELVLAAYAVDVDDRQTGVAGSGGDVLAPQRLLAQVIRRAIGNCQQLRAGGPCLARGLGEPDVLAD